MRAFERREREERREKRERIARMPVEEKRVATEELKGKRKKGGGGVIDDIFASAKSEKKKKVREEVEALKEKEHQQQKKKREKKKRDGAGGTDGEKFVPAVYSQTKDDIDLDALLPRYRRKKTNEGYVVYSERELRINQGGGTPLCPFECNCCF